MPRHERDRTFARRRAAGLLPRIPRMQRLLIALLGEPRIHVDDRQVPFASKKAAGLIYYLACSGGRKSRRELARLFWSGDQEAARTSLRSVLQRVPAELAPWLSVDRESIALLRIDDGSVTVDIEHFADLAAAEDIESLGRASELYGGDLLKGLDIDAAPEYDDWLHRERVRFRQIAQSVFDRLIAGHRDRSQRDSAHASSGREAAMAAARRWIALEPAAEAAHRWLMRLFFEAGQRDAALAQYGICQRELAVALGRAPDRETRSLHDSISTGGVDQPAPAGTDTSPARERPALTSPDLAGTTFVGRVDELAALEQLLSDPACRLLTLHALGGSGKSRLAFALANQIASRFRSGAVWVSLDAVASSADLPIAVARAAGLELGASADASAALTAVLRAQELFLVLDNFEHLIESGGADLVLAILREAPRVTMLVTSRETLGVQEEWVYEVPGLAFPDEVRPTAATDEFPATELFVQRARQTYLGFSARAEWPHVVRICALVEGLPLAIELAAAWVRTLPCGDLAQAIATEMAATASRHRNRPARQSSLDAVVRTSWTMLAREQQRALAALAIFNGGFTLEAAQAVAGASLRVVSALVDKALVNRRADGRLGLHELVRQFAAAQLASQPGEARAVRHRYAGFYADLLERCRSLLDGPQDVEAEAALSADLANLGKAQQLWFENQTIDASAEAWLRVMSGQGLSRPGVAFANRVLGGEFGLSAATRVAVLTWRGHCLLTLGDQAGSRTDIEAAIALARTHGLTRPLATALATSVIEAFYADDFPRVRTLIEELERCIAGLDDAYLRLRARYYAGLLLDGEGHSEAAESALRETLHMARSFGSPLFVATAQTSLATPLLRQGRLAEGELLLLEALPALERSGRKPFLARALCALSIAILWRSKGVEADVAARHAARALALFERAGSVYGESVAADALGMALLALGRVDEARSLFERAVRAGLPTVDVEAKFHLAWLHLKQGRPVDAARFGRELVELARGHALEIALRSATVVAAALASRAGGPSIRAARWLRRVLADPDIEFELRFCATEILVGDAAPQPGDGDGDLLAEVDAFLATAHVGPAAPA